MQQVIIGGWNSNPHTTNTEYNVLQGGYGWDGTEFVRGAIVSTAGVIKNLRVKLAGSPGGGKHYDFTLLLNGAPTALTLEIADAATSGSNMVNEIDVVAGDIVSLQCNPDGTPTARYVAWTSVFEGSTANESLILGSGRNEVGLTRYFPLMANYDNSTGDESLVSQICPTAGVIKNLYVEIDADPGSGGDAYRYTVRLNGATVGESSIVTITEPNKTGNDTAHNLVVAGGDRLTLMCEPLNVPSVKPNIQWGVTFVADTNGESVILGTSSDAFHQTVTEYTQLGSRGRGASWNAAENTAYQLGQECTLKKLYMRLTKAPGAGNKYTFTVRIAGDSNVVVEIADAATTGNSGALSDTVANDDYLSLKVVPTSNPDTLGAEAWGLVSYIVVPIDHTKEFSDSVAVTDAIGKAIGMAQSESVGVAESSGLEAEFSRSLSDSVVVAEVIVKSPSLFKTDTMAITESISVVKILNKLLADSIAIADSITSKAIGVFKTDTVAVAETFSKAAKFYKSLTDTVAISEAIVKAYSLVRAESIAVADSIVKAIEIFKTETVAVSESFSYLRGLFKTLTDTIAVSETLTKKAISIVRADTVAITDSTSKAFGKFRTETIAIIDHITLIFHPIVLKLKKRIFAFHLKER